MVISQHCLGQRVGSKIILQTELFQGKKSMIRYFLTPETDNSPVQTIVKLYQSEKITVFHQIMSTEI